MDNQQSLSSLAERLGSKRERLRDGAKEHRLSKADIGDPIITESIRDSVETSDSPGAPVGTLRYVIIQKNEKGYGLTVSGDNPVYVQSVKEDGAAHAAGVKQGDRIVKVNGTNVTDCNHVEVVKLIKSGAHVSLTLISPPLRGDFSNTGGSNASSHLTKRPLSSVSTETVFHDSKVSMIKKMLEQERDEVERIKEEYARNPNKKLLEDLGVAQKLMQDLEKQLWKAESAKPVQDTRTADTILVGKPVDTEEMDAATATEKNGSADRGVILQEKPKNFNTVQKDILNFEDDELNEGSEHYNHGPFKDFDTLKTKPAHMAVFLNYVFTKHDPSNLLLVLAVEQFRSITSAKELNKMFDFITKTYLMTNAPLKASIDEGIAKSIVSASSRSLSDEALRSVFDPATLHLSKMIREQLQQFCHHRELGLGNCYGNDKVSPNMDHSQEVKAIEEILSPLIQDLGSLQAGGQDDSEIQKPGAKIDALERLLSHWTGRRKTKITTRIGSMLRPKPAGTVLRQKNSTSMESIIDDPSKRMSILGKLSGKKTKKDAPSTVMPVLQSARQEDVEEEQGHVAAIVNKFQENSGSLSSINFSESGVGKKDPSGAIRHRDQKLSGKSNSDPDHNAVQMALGLTSEQSSDLGTQSSLSYSTSISSLSGSTTSTSSVPLNDMIQQIIAANPELDVEPESHWSATVPREIIKQHDKKECKRQEVINELLHTEKHHVRDLLILDLFFYQKMLTDVGLSQEEVFAVFPNLQEILRMHRKFKNTLMELKEKDGYVIKEIAPALLEMFDGDEGEKFKNACAKYCGNQSAALEFIKEKCKKDAKFNSFIQTTERHPIFRRLQLKDFIPGEFQRLTKYPLLVENIMKNTKKKEEVKLKQVHRQCKGILEYVNKAVKDAEDHQKIVQIQKNLDTSPLNKINHPIAQEYKNINLLQRKLVHQGPLTWRITQTEKKKSVELHCILFEDIMVLLQKQEDRYVLKCHHAIVTGPNSSKDESVQPPILKLSKVIVREVATDKRAFYVLSMSDFGGQIYELVASASHEVREWIKIVASAVDLAKKKESSRRDAFSVPETSRSESEKGASDVIILEGEANSPDQFESDAVDDVIILDRIQKQHKDIADALNTKQQMLAMYARIEPSELQNVIEMNLEDDDPDPTALVLHLLSSCKELLSILNDGLTPDSDFLQPQRPVVLLPTSEENTRDSNLSDSTDNKSSLSIVVSDATTNLLNNVSVESNVEAVTVTGSENETDYALEAEVQLSTVDQQSNDRGSDYETASEPASPSSGDENLKFVEEVVEQQEVNDAKNNTLNLEHEEEDNQETVDPLPTSESIEIPSDELGGAEQQLTDNSTDQLFSPIPLDSDDLLDFGSNVITPPESAAVLSPRSPGTFGLIGRTNPVNFTRMLQITQGMEAQLMRLLRTKHSTMKVSETAVDDSTRVSEEQDKVTKRNSMSAFYVNSSSSQDAVPLNEETEVKR